MAILKNSSIASTFQMPSGSTAERPVSPTSGMMRFNTSYNIMEIYNGSQWWDMNNNVPSDIGLSSTAPATSGTQLKHVRPMFTSGDYYIKPPGQSCYQVYVDMLNQGGGWVLVGSGREGIYGSANSWWVDTGSPNGLYATNLKYADMSNTTPRYMSTDWIRALVKGYAWSSLCGMIINRTVAGDSFYLRNSTSNFKWSSFGGATDVQTMYTAVTMSYSRYSGQWLSGTNTYNFTNTNWGDTLSSGSPVANDVTRMFTWSWSGHKNAFNQYTGISAGSSYTNGFQVGTEGHSIQQVNIFVK